MGKIALRYDAIVFDFDGVLVESVDIKTRAFVELYRPHGESVARAVADYHLSHGGVSRYEKFRHFHHEFLGKDLPADEERGLASRFSVLVEDAVVKAPWVPGAREFLADFKGRLPMFVASATPTTELKRIVERRGMNDYFNGVWGAPATKREIITDVVRINKIPASRVLMVGDAVSDLQGAYQASVNFVGVVRRNQSNPFPSNVTIIADINCLKSHLIECSSSSN